MKLNCQKCRRELKTGDEVRYTALGFYQDIPSQVTFSVSEPYEVLADSLEHLDCAEVNQ